MVFEVVQRRRVEALDLRFSASHQIIRSHVPILQPARCLSCCVLFRVRSSMRWRIHQKGSMFWTRHSTLPLDFSRNDQLLDTNYNTNYWGSQDHLKLFHIALLGWNLNPIILLFLRSQLTKMLHEVFSEPTHAQKKSRSSWAECFTHCVDCCVLVACCYVLPPESERHRWATV